MVPTPAALAEMVDLAAALETTATVIELVDLVLLVKEIKVVMVLFRVAAIVQVEVGAVKMPRVKLLNLLR